MLKVWQVIVLAGLGAAMWALVTWGIHAHPERALDASRALRGSLMAPVGGVISVWLCKLAGRLSAAQLLPGVVVTGAVAMALDGWAIRWAPQLYGASDKALALSGAGLLWGYGIGLIVALLWAGWLNRKRTNAVGE
jgi:hypothetical protein